MSFISWQIEYQRAKDALANKTWDLYFIASVENSHQLRTSYTRLGNITSFIEWLKMMADEESNNDPGISLIIGGA